MDINSAIERGCLELKVEGVDWPTIFASLGAAIIGALSSYFFSVYQERNRRLANQQALLNTTISAVIVSLEKLIAFKQDFLERHNEEYKIFSSHSAKYKMGTAPSADLIFEYNTVLEPVFQVLFDPNQKVNLLHVWAGLRLPTFPQVIDLGFLLEYNRQVTRYLEAAITNYNNLIHCIEQRNIIREKNSPLYLKGIWPDSEIMGAYYQLLQITNEIKELCDRTLISLDVLYGHLEDCVKKFPKNFFFWKRIFLKAVFPDEYKKYIPIHDRAVLGFKK